MKPISVIDLVMLRQVPGSVIGMILSTREADTAFADLICADPQWLDAEFDAVIAASFSGPPASRPPAPPRVPPRPGTPSPLSRGPRPRPAAISSPAARPDHCRQRSPPAHRPLSASGMPGFAGRPDRPGPPGARSPARVHIALSPRLVLTWI
jgi:hypothetical protein